MGVSPQISAPAVSSRGIDVLGRHALIGPVHDLATTGTPLVDKDDLGSVMARISSCVVAIDPDWSWLVLDLWRSLSLLVQNVLLVGKMVEVLQSFNLSKFKFLLVCDLLLAFL